MKGQHIDLITSGIPTPGRAWGDRETEMVTGVRINGTYYDLPEGGLVKVEYSAGGSLGTVTLELLADSVRYVSREALETETKAATSEGASGMT